MRINENYNLVYMKNYFKNMTEFPIIKKEGVDKSTYSNEVYFLLSYKGGLQICSKLMICILGTQRPIIKTPRNNDNDIVTWNYGQIKDAMGATTMNQKIVWSLKSVNKGSDEPKFFIKMPVEDKKHKLIMKKENPINNSELVISNKTKDGCSNLNKTVWTIELNKV